MDEYWPRLKACVEPMTVEQIWWRPNDASNSIGNLILHLNGNVTQWIVASFNRDEDKRDRPAEFSASRRPYRSRAPRTAGRNHRRGGRSPQPPHRRELLAPYEIQGYETTVSTLSSRSWTTSPSLRPDRLHRQEPHRQRPRLLQGAKQNRPPLAAACFVSESPLLNAATYPSELISITKRYFTSCFSIRSKASLTFWIGIISTSAVMLCLPQ